jgi:hypothetical protein
MPHGLHQGVLWIVRTARAAKPHLWYNPTGREEKRPTRRIVMQSVKLSRSAHTLLRRRANGEHVELTPDNLEAYRELAKAGVMYPLSGFMLGPEAVFRFTEEGWNRREEPQLRIEHAAVHVDSSSGIVSPTLGFLAEERSLDAAPEGWPLKEAVISDGGSRWFVSSRDRQWWF